jgi:two-component system, OmpR family, sensor histidine kinase AdeS
VQDQKKLKKWEIEISMDRARNFMKKKSGISKQLFIALSIVNLSVTLFSVLLGYYIYNYAIDVGWITLSALQEDWTEFHFVDWIWLATVVFCGSVISLIIGMHLAQRFIKPINFLAEAAEKISLGDLSARADDRQIHSAEISELMNNFNHMAQKLELSVKNAQVWNAAIAHELRTPITILQGRLQGIIDGVFEPDERLFKSLLGQVEGLSHLVEDLRTLSLVENQQLRLNYEWVNTQEVIERVLSLFEDRLANAHLVPELYLDAPAVRCDRRRIEQVLVALIDNTIRYAYAGQLNISSKIVNEQWVLQIEDQGPGIAPEYQACLFDPFFRLEQSRNKEFGGTGLGLAVVHAIVVAHQGSIEYHNKNSNSVFTITIPCRE